MTGPELPPTPEQSVHPAEQIERIDRFIKLPFMHLVHAVYIAYEMRQEELKAARSRRTGDNVFPLFHNVQPSLPYGYATRKLMFRLADHMMESQSINRFPPSDKSPVDAEYELKRTDGTIIESVGLLFEDGMQIVAHRTFLEGHWAHMGIEDADSEGRLSDVDFLDYRVNGKQPGQPYFGAVSVGERAWFTQSGLYVTPTPEIMTSIDVVTKRLAEL